MFKYYLRCLGFYGLLVPLLASCTKDECKEKMTYIQKEPQYKSAEEIHSEVGETPSRALYDAGKIFFRTDGYIFVNEPGEGIHIYDNQDPKNPTKETFLKIPGNTDMAVRGDVLYANSYVDLYTFRVSNPGNPSILSRRENVFDETSRPGENIGQFVEGEGVIVGYKDKKKTKTVKCSQNRAPQYTGTTATSEGSGSRNSTDFSSGSDAAGIGGSMARFATNQDHLYTVDWNSLHIFDLNTPGEPDEVDEMQLPWGIETIFPYKDNLFIGSQTSMFIYDNSNPTNPTREGEFRHARVCDPVYPTDSFAYVTLNGNNGCGQAENQLDVLNITDLSNPQLIESYPMDDPQGLAVSDKILFLCDGTSGLEVYDVHDPEAIAANQLDEKSSHHAFDVIPSRAQDYIMVIGDDGLYQYDVGNPRNLTQLSQIPVKQGNPDE